MTPHVIQELHADRWHGVEVRVQPASSKNLVCMSRSKAQEKRQELALRYIESEGHSGRRPTAAGYLAISLALDVADANANEIVVELSKAAVEFIGTRFDFKLRLVSTSKTKQVVTGTVEALAALEVKIRGVFFKATAKEQRLLLTAQRALAEAVGSEPERPAGPGAES